MQTPQARQIKSQFSTTPALLVLSADSSSFEFTHAGAVVVVGDSGVGKPGYLTDINSSYTIHRKVDGADVSLLLCDSQGQAEYDRLRPLDYPHTDVFILCFSLVDPGSYEHVRTKWYPELIYHGATASSIILVGTKLDLRTEPPKAQDLSNRRRRGVTPISYSEGAAMARDIGVAKYCECSAFTREGVSNIFEEAVRAAIHRDLSPVEERRSPGTCIVA